MQLYQRHSHDSRETFVRVSYDSRETFVRLSHDCRETFMRVFHDVRVNVTQFNFSQLMPSLHLAYDELTAIVRCLNSHFRAISVRRPYNIVRFLGVVGSS